MLLTTTEAVRLSSKFFNSRHGPEGLAHGNCRGRSPQRLPDTLRAQIVALVYGTLHPDTPRATLHRLMPRQG